MNLIEYCIVFHVDRKHAFVDLDFGVTYFLLLAYSNHWILWRWGSFVWPFYETFAFQ